MLLKHGFDQNIQVQMKYGTALKKAVNALCEILNLHDIHDITDYTEKDRKTLDKAGLDKTTHDKYFRFVRICRRVLLDEIIKHFDKTGE